MHECSSLATTLELDLWAPFPQKVILNVVEKYRIITAGKLQKMVNKYGYLCSKQIAFRRSFLHLIKDQLLVFQQTPLGWFQFLIDILLLQKRHSLIEMMHY